MQGQTKKKTRGTRGNQVSLSKVAHWDKGRRQMKYNAIEEKKHYILAYHESPLKLYNLSQAWHNSDVFICKIFKK